MLHSPAWCLCTQWNDVKSQQHSQTNAWNLWNIHCIICFLNEKAYSWHVPVGFMDNTKVYWKFVRYKMVCQQSGQHDIQEVMQSWFLRKLENSLLTLGAGFLKGGEVCIITSLSKKLHKTLRMLLLSLSGNKTTQEASLVGGHFCEWNSCSERCIVVWTTMQDKEIYCQGTYCTIHTFVFWKIAFLELYFHAQICFTFIRFGSSSYCTFESRPNSQQVKRCGVALPETSTEH